MSVLKIKTSENTWEKVNSIPSISIDTTLTQSGVAADSKIVGDKLAEKQPIGDYAIKSELGALANKNNVSKSDLDTELQETLDKIGEAYAFVQDDEPANANTGTLWLDTDEESTNNGSGSGTATSIPTFNLTEMGLPTVPMDGTIVSVETDTTAIRAALDSGLIKVTFNMNFNGYTIPVTSIDRGAYIAAEDNYQVCTMSHTYNAAASEHKLHTAVFNIHSTYIAASIVGTGLALPDAEEASF